MLNHNTTCWAGTATGNIEAIDFDCVSISDGWKGGMLTVGITAFHSRGRWSCPLFFTIPAKVISLSFLLRADKAMNT